MFKSYIYQNNNFTTDIFLLFIKIMYPLLSLLFFFYIYKKVVPVTQFIDI